MKQIVLARQIGLVVRRKRQKLGMTQQQLADAAGVSRGFIIRLEKGVSVAVYPEKLLEVLAELDLSLWVADTGDEDGACGSLAGGDETERRDARDGRIACGIAGEHDASDEAVVYGGAGGAGGESRERSRCGRGGKHVADVDIPPLQINPALLKPFKLRRKTLASDREGSEPRSAREEACE